MGIVAKAIGGLSVADSTKSLYKGAEEMVVAALVGFAKGIQVVLEDGHIMDTLIYSAANVLRDFHNVFAAEGMLVFQSMLNFFIPSGSGQAATTMPLMAPLSDVLGLSRQTAVFAFTCGDGFSNTIIPTSGVLMAMLALAKIPYEKWLKFMFPLFIQLMILAGIFLAIKVYWF
ncbi:MAG: TIGR00366 family protein [Saprospiraceae bacterium]